MRDSGPIDGIKPDNQMEVDLGIASVIQPADRDARVLAFWRRVNRCRECLTIAPWRKFPLGRRGTTRFGLMILGEAPGRVSLETGRPFSNPRTWVTGEPLPALPRRAKSNQRRSSISATL